MSTPRDRTRPLTVALLVGALALVGPTACSSDDDDPGATGAAAELARHLPADGRDLLLIDLDAAREAYDLPEDAGLDREQGFEGFQALVASALPTDVRSDPDLRDAIDTGALHTSAQTTAVEPVTVLRTDQPWDDLVGELVAAGWERAGDRATRGERTVAHDGDLVVWASGAEAADAALEPHDRAVHGLVTVTDLVDRVVVFGLALPGSSEPTCATGVVVGQDPGDAAGDVAVRVQGGASWGEGGGDGWELSDQEDLGARLTARFELSDAEDDDPLAAYRAFLEGTSPASQVACDDVPASGPSNP